MLDPGETPKMQKKLVQASLTGMLGLQPSPVKSPWSRPTMVRDREAEKLRLEMEREASAALAEARALKMKRSRGPPVKPADECRGVQRNPLIKSNRLQHGMKRRRWDPNPHEGLQICMKYEESVAAGSSPVEALSALVQTWSRRRSSLKTIVCRGRPYWENMKREKMKVLSILCHALKNQYKYRRVTKMKILAAVMVRLPVFNIFLLSMQTFNLKLDDLSMGESRHRRLLYGGKIIIYTNHKNLTFKTLSIQQI